MRNKIVSIFMVLGVIVGFFAPGASASSTYSTEFSAATPHCLITAQREGQPATAQPQQCYATHQQALDSVEATVIGIEYETSGFGGWSYLIQSTSPEGCKTGYTYKVPTLPANRDNKISSARSYTGCKSRHFSGTNMTGSTYLCGCSQMGAMNDQTSSIRFSSSGY